MTQRTTRVEQCIRCGEFDLIEGVLDTYFHGRALLKFWTDQQAIPLRSFVCRSCGHVELLARFDKSSSLIPGKARSCPKCDAVYSYQKKHEVSEGVVRCQNCGVEFHLSVQIECPYCTAVYLYSLEKTNDNTVVPCQNCGKSFLLSDELEVSKDLIEDNM